MARLPQPGADTGTWGDILNDFLSTAHETDGSLKNSSIKPATLDAGPPNAGQVLSYDGAGLAWSTITSSGGIPDADGSTKGLLQLSGDLAGTASAPTVPGLSSKANMSALNSHIADTANPHATTKTQIGLSNVDNTSDINKPVSTATQTALALKANDSALSSHIANTANPHGVNASQIGLSNVNNTSDINKPVSTATQTALALKANLASPTFTGVVTVPTPTNNTDATTKAYVDATASAGTPDANSTTKGKIQLTGDLGGTAASPTVPGLAGKADTSALALKANLASPTFTGVVTVPTPTNNTDATTKAYVDATASAGTPDANSTTKGKIQLTGDLGGTAASPTVPGLAGKADTSHVHAATDITSGTIAPVRLGSGSANSTTYLRGDGTWAAPSGGASGMLATAKSANYTASSFDFIIANVVGGPFTITLPPVSNGAMVSVKKIDSSANAVTIQPQSGSIDGLVSDSINNQWVSMDYFSDGTNWYRI